MAKTLENFNNPYLGYAIHPQEDITICLNENYERQVQEHLAKISQEKESQKNYKIPANKKFFPRYKPKAL